jgi:hypothetical protein
MKKSLFLLVLGLFTAMAINAQDLKLDEILKKHDAAVGQEKLGTAKTLKMVGKMSMMGMEMPITMIKKRPNKMRNEIEFQGTKMIQTYNGVDGYMINPMMGSTEAQKVGDDQLAQFKDQSDMDGKFFNYKEKGSTIELVGTEDINSAKAYKLKIVEKSGKTSYSFIDCTNFNVVKSISTENMQGVDTEIETYFTYQQIDGITMPLSLEMKAGGNVVYQMTFTEIKINEEYADDLFEKPTN